MYYVVLLVNAALNLLTHTTRYARGDMDAAGYPSTWHLSSAGWLARPARLNMEGIALYISALGIKKQ